MDWGGHVTPSHLPGQIALLYRDGTAKAGEDYRPRVGTQKPNGALEELKDLQRATVGWTVAESWFHDVEVVESDPAEPAVNAKAVADARLAIVECAVRVWLRTRQGGTA